VWTSNVILRGAVIVEGIAFRWAVTEGLAQRLTVTHAMHGARTEALNRSPDSQARAIGRAMLHAARPCPSTPYLPVRLA
jgi:hypothetical protein